MKALLVVAIIGLAIGPPGSSGIALIPVLQLAGSAASVAMHAWHHLKTRNDATLSDLAMDMNKLQVEMSGIESVVRNTEFQMYGLVSQLSKNTRTELRLHELSELVSRISSTSKLMNEYMKNPNVTEKITLEDFARWCISHNPESVPGLLERINSITSPMSEPGLINPGVLSLLLETMKESDHYMWDMQQSPNQLLYNMYNTIILTEVKGFTMMQFSWMILRLYGKGNFTVESQVSQRRYEERINTAVEACKMIMSEANSVIWRSDPKQHLEGNTYESLTRLLQGYIENEVDMNKDGTCKENCAYYQVSNNQGCFKEQFCSKQKICNGKIVDCKFVESDMKICQAERHSKRRYEWIEFKSKDFYGDKRKKSCSRSTTQVESWWRWLFWHCSYCICICDQSGPDSDRYFSLREELADVKNNKVVVGIRFTKLKRVIYMQICEGILLPGGKIDRESVTWKKINPIDLKYATKYIDYLELSNEERAIDLDDLEGPKGYIVTGVRFKRLGAHLNFEIQTMPFEFETGDLHTDKYAWISNDNTPVTHDKMRTILTLDAPDVPVKPFQPSKPDSTHNQYVKFTHTDMRKDVAQTTIPYLDIQPVISKIPIPLSGAGLYHKGVPGSGGFLAPKIFTYDYTSHFNSFYMTKEIIEDKKESTEAESSEVEFTTMEINDFGIMDLNENIV